LPLLSKTVSAAVKVVSLLALRADPGAFSAPISEVAIITKTRTKHDNWQGMWFPRNLTRFGGSGI
jgi:hypothetical protein